MSRHTLTLFLRRKSAGRFTFIAQKEETYTFALHFPQSASIIKAKEYVLLSATSMRNVITLSMCVRGNDDDRKIVERFFDLMEESIGLLIEGNK